VAGIGRDRQHLLLLAIERIGVKAEFFVPEGLVKAANSARAFARNACARSGLPSASNTSAIRTQAS